MIHLNPIEVNKELLTITLRKPTFSYQDIARFRNYQWRWQPNGEIVIQIRGNTYRSIIRTIQTLYPDSFRVWSEEYRKKTIDDIRHAFKLFQEGFDNAVKEKCPLFFNMFEHQKEAARILCYKQYTLLSFEQGLGKSMTALIPSLILDTPVTLIIVPNSLKYNWKEEMTVTWQNRFGHSVPENQITILSAGNKSVFAQNERFIIINFDMVKKYFDYILEKNIKRVIIDECHYIKNRDAQRTKAIRDLITKLNQRSRCAVVFNSGTPAPNKIIDIYSYLEISRHPHGTNYKQFVSKFCVTRDNAFGKTIVEGKNIDELSIDIENLMIRKLKEDCIDLPPKRYIKIDFENDEYDKMYQDAYNELLKKIMESGGKRSVDSLSCLNVLQIITAKAKVKPCIELAENIISDFTTVPNEVTIPATDSEPAQIITKGTKQIPKKVAIMCNFKEPLYTLKEYFKDKCVLIDGSVDAEKRMTLVNNFRYNDDIQVFLGQTTAVGVGLNLTECSDVIFLNFPYTRAEIEQAADRFHRIGQKVSVNVYFSVLVGKIDETIYKILVGKYRDISKLIDKKVDNTETIKVGDEILDLFQEITKQLELGAKSISV